MLERSHLVVQIVDARNPLRFRCEDLDAYVQDVEGPEGEQGTGKGKRKTLLLINKSDLLTAKQRCGYSSSIYCHDTDHCGCILRRQWADYFDSQGVQYAFFSAANSAALQQARRDALAEQEALLEAEERAANESTQEENEKDDGGEGQEQQSADAPPSDSESEDEEPESEDADDSDDESFHTPLVLEEDSEDARDPRARVLSVLELEELFVKSAPDLSGI